MAFFDFFKVFSADHNLQKFDLSRNHVCTHDFGTVKPIMSQYLIPKDKFDINVTQFTRLMPLPCPTFGNVRTITRAFFVPFSKVMGNFNDFIADNYTFDPSLTTGNTIVPTIPYFELEDLFTYWCLHSGDNYVLEVTSESESCDFVYDRRRWVFTKKGKLQYDLLVSLGCNIPLHDLSGVVYGSMKISALPLLCYQKFYRDWILPVRLRASYSVPNYSATNAKLNESQLGGLLGPYSAIMESDYFNSAFATPFGPENAAFNAMPYTMEIANPANDSNNYVNGVSSGKYQNLSVGSHVNATGAGANNNSAINAFTIKSLGVLQDMVNKKRISGNDLRAWLNETFGINYDNELLHLSDYLGEKSNDIMIGDIMSSATTEANGKITLLGQYAGKGIGGNAAHFHFEAKEHGMLFITNEITAKTSYTQGLKDDFMMLNREDFYLPELDGLGMTAIACKELAFDLGTDTGDATYDPNGVFGFKPTYAEKKYSQDIVSGDFRLFSENAGLDSWYLNRVFDKDNWDALSHWSAEFLYADEDGVANNYDRIFSVNDSFSDHFYSVFRLDVNALRPMKSLTDSLEMEETGKGHEVNISKGIQ